MRALHYDPGTKHHLSFTCFLHERILRAFNPACRVRKSSSANLRGPSLRRKGSVLNDGALLKGS